jgi:hypothetical protein
MKEWEKIVGYIRKNNDGIIIIKHFNHQIQRYLSIPCEPEVEDFAFEGPLFWVLDEEINPCPFLRFELKDGRYYCKIQEIKPEACEGFFCEPNNTYPYLDKDAILNFGHILEYPRCLECKKFDSLGRTRETGEKTQCEKGEGCHFFERRINFFLRYARSHPDQKKVHKQEDKLITILGKQDEVFKGQINSNLKLTESQIGFNKDKYLKMIGDIKTVLGRRKI